MQTNIKDIDSYIETNLKKNNLKLTSQRIAVYKYLLNTTSHPTADTIYNDLKPNHPNLSIGTVYKTLYSFKNNGLILEFNVGEDKFRYDSNITPHIHLVCKECNTVIDLDFGTDLASITKKVKNEYFIPTDILTIVSGTCKNCNI